MDTNNDLHLSYQLLSWCLHIRKSILFYIKGRFFFPHSSKLRKSTEGYCVSTSSYTSRFSGAFMVCAVVTSKISTALHELVCALMHMHTQSPFVSLLPALPDDRDRAATGSKCHQTGYNSTESPLNFAVKQSSFMLDEDLSVVFLAKPC